MQRKDTPLLPCLILALTMAGGASAQQDPMYTMYMWNMMSVNPAYAGSADVMNATATARRQWVGMDGAPTTNAFLAHSPLRLRSIGLGLSVVEDRIGPSRSASYFADFAYRIRVTPNSRLAFGLKAGGSTMRLDLAEVSGTDVNDPVYQRNLSSGFRPNFGFGLYYWSHKGYIGLSAPKLLNAPVTGSNENGEVQVYEQEMHGFLTAGYVFELSRDVKLRPALLVKGVQGAPASADLSANLLFREKLWAGLSYRTSNDVATILSYQLSEQLRAGYAYDLSLSPLRTRNSGSHELMVSYDLLFSKRNLRSPRYF